MEKILDCGVSEVVLCDTIGVADPVQVQALSKQARALCGEVPTALHLHDTRGMGLVNICAGIDGGISRFETSAGGLGGCPFAPGAAGNTATEDAVNMLHAIGADTGICLESLLEAVALIKRYIKPDLTSHMGNIGACNEA
jgi:hydroxymethylglutaryl-CoA lyase